MGTAKILHRALPVLKTDLLQVFYCQNLARPKNRKNACRIQDQIASMKYGAVAGSALKPPKQILSYRSAAAMANISTSTRNFFNPIPGFRFKNFQS